MSTYTIGEIAIWLVLAALLGFALGWLTRELASRRATATAPAPAPAADPRPMPPAPTSVPTVPKPATTPTVQPGPHPGSALSGPDGSAPTPEHTIKVSGSSKIYHAPSSPAWGRTTAAFWFMSAEAAEDAGFRKPKNG